MCLETRSNVCAFSAFQMDMPIFAMVIARRTLAVAVVAYDGGMHDANIASERKYKCSNISCVHTKCNEKSSLPGERWHRERARYIQYCCRSSLSRARTSQQRSVASRFTTMEITNNIDAVNSAETREGDITCLSVSFDYSHEHDAHKKRRSAS